MMRYAVLGALALLATGCDRPSTREKARSDARAVAQVEAAQKLKPPAQPIAPQPLEPADIAALKFVGGCQFALEALSPAAPGAPGGGSTLTPIAAMGRERGLVKVAGEATIFAADTGSARFPADSYEKYAGRGHTLTFTKGESAPASSGSSRWSGSMMIRDHLERVVFFSPGVLTCGG